MSWRLFSNTIKHPGHEYSLQTIPTLSSALEFDVRLNQPDFMKMLDKRIEQAANAAEAMDLYREAYDLDDYGISILDPDVYSAEVMDLIASIEEERKGHDMENEEYDMDSTEALRAQLGSGYDMFNEDDEINEDVREDLAARQEMLADRVKMRYAEGQISREHLMSESGQVLHHLDGDIIAAYREAKHPMASDARFFRTDANGSLCSLDGQMYISQGVLSKPHRPMRRAVCMLTMSRSLRSRIWVHGESMMRFIGSCTAWNRGRISAEALSIALLRECSNVERTSDFRGVRDA